MDNMITALSPTSLAIFEASPEEFYLQYKLKLKRLPQTKPMSIGSAFDARVKSYLVGLLGGSQLQDGRFELNTLYDSQVEIHNRELVRSDSERLFNAYLASGALEELLVTATRLCSSAKFELDIRGLVNLEGSEVPIRGKPDVAMKLNNGTTLIVDFKVNGFYSKAYPKAGYINIRPDRKIHKDAVLGTYAGLTINLAARIPIEWENQLITYAWLMGVPVGQEFLAGIEQIVCQGDQYRFATFRSLIGKQPQLDLFARYTRAWSVITSEHFFRNMSETDSKTKCNQLDALKSGNSNDQWLLEHTR